MQPCCDVFVNCCLSCCLSNSQDAGSLRKKNKKKKRGKVLNTRASSGDSDVAVNMTNSVATDSVQPDAPALRGATQVGF